MLGEFISWDKVMLDQVIQHNPDTFFHRHFMSLDVDIRLLGCFIGCRDASEFLDFTCLGFLVQAFWIALLNNFKWSISENLSC